MRRLITAAALCVPLTGCNFANPIEALKPQSLKDAEEKKSLMDSCMASSRAFYSAKEAIEVCRCGYNEFKLNGMSAFDAGMKCGEETLKKRKS